MFTDYTTFGPSLLGNPREKTKASFRLQNVNLTIANTIRRAILTYTPSVGFRTEPYDASDIKISVNTTPLVNEMIAHRIGMIPINVLPSDGDFNPENYTFELDVTNSSKDILDVRASDFKVYLRNSLETPELLDTNVFFPPDPITGQTVLITRLRPQWNESAPKEQIKLTARASISTGSENIRYSPVCQASYEYTRDTDPVHYEEVFTKWYETHKKIADANPDATTLEDVKTMEDFKKEFNTMEIQRCYLTDEKGEPNDFTFHLESVGVQPIPYIVQSALASIDAMLKKYIDIDKQVLPNVRIQSGDSRFASIDFIFEGEGHSLGNLLETYLIENIVREDGEINYAGYKIPHPLRKEMLFRVGVREGIEMDPKAAACLAIKEACSALRDQFKALSMDWSRSMGYSGVTESKEQN